MLSFKITVVAIVAVILLLFAFGAYKAEIVVKQKAKENREAQAAKISSTNSKKKK